MKKFLISIIIIAIVIGVAFKLFKDNKAYDDTKKLYITCNNVTKDYEVYSSDKLEYLKDKECFLNIMVRNVTRDYLKLELDKKVYSTKINGDIDENSFSNVIYLNPNSDSIYYNYDKKIKYIFSYK